MRTRSTPLYRHTNTALLRAASLPLHRAPGWWPDPDDTGDCRRWLAQVWAGPEFSRAVRDAGEGLAAQVDAVLGNIKAPARTVRRATESTARYVLRITGRPSPFGLLAGVANVTLGGTGSPRVGTGHRTVARVDTQWLGDIIDTLEAIPDLREHLDVVFSNLAVERGRRVQLPKGGPVSAHVRNTTVVQAVRAAAATPTPMRCLAADLADTFPDADPARIAAVLADLIRERFLLTSLRPPMTEADPLAYLVDRLRAAQADTVPTAAALLWNLESLHAALQEHNRAGGPGDLQGIGELARALSPAGRTPLATDLRLDCTVPVPEAVARELERAAGVLLRLSRHPAGEPAWHDYATRFWERYSSGTLVPLADVLNAATGLGFPAGYPGSTMPPPVVGPTRRDQCLLALAWEAVTTGEDIVLTDDLVNDLTADSFDERHIPSHVEVAARIYAATTDDLDHGRFTIGLTPARSAGTLTSRFTLAATGTGLDDVYRTVPPITEGALPAQLSFPPLYPHSENICRVPAYLPDVISLGEHRSADDHTIALDDLAVMVHGSRLYLVSMSRRQVIEPQCLHAMALEKQPPAIARFLAHLPRAFAASWTGFDWGPHAVQLPYLPRVRYCRTILSPARWNLTTVDAADQPTLDRWRKRWNCPTNVELREDDRTLRLNLGESLHVRILTAHLRRNGTAILTEAAPADAFGWLDGHVHEIAVPMVAAGPPAPSPLATGTLPTTTNATRGFMPGSPHSRWINAKVFTDPELCDEILTDHLPRLVGRLPGEPWLWFIRYRSATETDHLRLRIRVRNDQERAGYAAAVGVWGEELLHAGLAGTLALDTYAPEVGRYGPGPAMKAAEQVFVADTDVVLAGLRHLPASVIDPTALVVANLLDIAAGFLGHDAALAWLADRPVPTGPAADRDVAAQAVNLALHGLRQWPQEVTWARKNRMLCLGFYRAQLPAHTDLGTVLETLFHMHHNRAVGLDRDHEQLCRRLLRQAALTHQATSR